jgi:hypothetical protein
MRYGVSAGGGLSFFVNVGGDDVYDADDNAEGDPFGVVLDPRTKDRVVGVFMDLGGGKDVYRSSFPGVQNDAAWSIPPRGVGALPEVHKGIGLDR